MPNEVSGVYLCENQGMADGLPKEKQTVTSCYPGKSVKTCQLFQNREYGHLKNSSFDINFLRLKTEKMPVVEEHLLPGESSPDSHDITFLKAGAKSLYSIWSTNKSEASWFEDIPHRFSPERNGFHVDSFFQHSRVNDICDGYCVPKVIVTVSNDLRGRGKIEYNYLPGSYFEVVRHYPTSVWCCCSNNFKQLLAFGGQNNIDILQDNICTSNKTIRGEVHSVEFNKIGTLLFSGIDTGKVIMTDLRDSGNPVSFQLDDVGIDETVLLSDENVLLCGSFAGMLCKFDLRKMAPVTHYLRHNRSSRKVPFSFSERFNLLCAHGCDNKTRLWSLSGGEPIQTLTPKFPEHPCRAWLVTSSYQCLLYSVQKRKVFIHEIFVNDIW